MYLHFTQSLEPLEGAGLGYSALGLHQGMLAGGIDSRLVSTRGAGERPQWDAVTQYPRRGPTRIFYAPEMMREARTLVEAADCVHAHGFYVAPNWLLGRQARRQGKPLVHHVQGFLDPWILRRSRAKKRLVHRLFEDANFRHAAWWRASSEKEHDQIRACGIDAPIAVIPNGVHLPTVRAKAEAVALAARFPKQRAKRLVFLSRIHPKKGLDLLIPAWGQLHAKHPDWELAIFGPDEGGYRAEVERLIGEAGVADSVTFYGSVSGDEKEAAFRSGDLFILPSYSEGFPMAVLEASAHGLPVVLTNECNFPELAANDGGWQCRPDLESVIASLEMALATDETERRQRGEAGRKLVAENYAWTSIATQVEDACRKWC